MTAETKPVDVTAWTKPSEPYLDACEHRRPRYVQMDVSTPAYTGPLVVLVYQTPDGEETISINGVAFRIDDGDNALAHVKSLLGEDADTVMTAALDRIFHPERFTEST